MFLWLGVMYKDKCVFVMPTYNTYKQKTRRVAHLVLEDLIQAIRKNMIGRQQTIIINDGCTDDTEKELIRSLKKKNAKRCPKRNLKISYKICKSNLELTISILPLIVHEGLNIAVVSGYKEALKSKPEFVIKLDSDGEHNPFDFPKLLKCIKRRR